MRHRRWICGALAVVALAAGCSDDDTKVRAESSDTTDTHKRPAAGEDHWHLAIGFNRCGTWLEPPADAHGDKAGIHTHGDGLIHVHPFFNEVSGDNATLKWFLEDIGATVDDESLKLASGDVLPFSGQCDGEDATLRVVRWRSAEDHPVMSTIEDADDLLDQALRPDGAVIAIVFTADEQVDQPPSVANLAEPSDTRSTAVTADTPHVPNGIPDPANVVSFAPVLWIGPTPCSETRKM